MKICDLPDGYKPSKNEAFMNDMQLEYFRRKLVSWEEALTKEIEDAYNRVREYNDFVPDNNDRASYESEIALYLRTKDRATKLISKIRYSLSKIYTHEYGYCEATGEPISLERLESRPIATMCIEAQVEHEIKQDMQKKCLKKCCR